MDCKFTTELGLVTVNDDVLVRVAGYAALDCYGIVGMASKRSTDGIVQLMGRENLGRGVKIVTGRKKGRIELEYYGMDDLNDLLEALALLRTKQKGPQA